MWGCLLFCGGLRAVPAGDIWKEANEAYRRKDYEAAMRGYERIAAQQPADAALCYNMGNTCFRLNRLGESVLWYERALRLQPSNADIRANLAYVNSQTVDQMEVLPEFFLKRWITAFRSLFSVTGWAVVSVVTSLLLFVVLALFLLAPDLRRRIRLLALSLIMLLFLAIGIVMAFSQKHALERTDEAVVTSLSVPVRSMPDASGTELFTVHEGMKVRITDAVGDWSEAVFPNGSKGWVQTRQLTII